MNYFRKPQTSPSGRDLNTLDVEGLAPLHHGASHDNIDIVRSLLEGGADVNFPSRTGKRALHYAALAGKDKVLRLLLSNPDVDVDAKDSDQRTALQDAAHTGNAGAASLLFQNGASFAHRSKDGRSAADLAIERGHLPVLEALVQGGANLLTLGGKEALLHQAALLGHVTIVKYLLVQGIPVDSVFNRMTALARTVAQESSETTKVLLEAGASPDSVLAEGPNLLALAVFNRRATTVQLLLDFSANPMHLVNDLSAGISALQAAIECAVKGGDESIIDILLDAEANILAFQKGESPSPLELCRLHGRRDLLAKLLKSHYRLKGFGVEQDLDIFMSFLPSISKPLAYAPVRVPLLLPLKKLEDPTIDMRRDFLSFPKVRGWTVEADNSLHRKGAQGKSLPFLAGFLQEWLFFGLLKAISQVVGFDYSPRHFLRRANDGKIFLYTDAVAEFQEKWLDTEESLQSEAALLAERDPSFQDMAILSIVSRLNLIDDYFQQAQSVLSRAFSPNDMEADADSAITPNYEGNSQAQQLFDESSLAITILGEVLVASREKFYSGYCRLEADKQSSNNYSAVLARQYEASGDLLEDYESPSVFKFPIRFTYQRMRKNKWCLSEAYMLHSLKFGAASLYFLSLLNRPSMKIGHESCSSYKCEVMQVDETKYETQHATEGCKCQHVSVDIDAVQSSLAKDEYPVLQVVDGGNLKDLSLRVSNGTQNVHIAFSHVWGQGMGNPFANSLPACQLRRLSQLARSAVEDLNARHGLDWEADDTFFWLDTLCVPLEKQGRKKALRLLRDVYEKALLVLALDAELYTVSANCTHAEQLGRVLLSPWMRRLWTLQEGLSNSTAGLVYQFAEKTLSNGGEVGSLQLEYETMFEGRLSKNLAETLRDILPPVWEVKYTSGHKLLNILQASCYRTSSKAEDEVRCLGSLLKLDTNRLESTTGATEEMKLQNRRRVFYEMLGDESCLSLEFRGIPTNVLFMDGPRLNQSGFMWAPISFLARKPSEILVRQHEVPPAFVRGKGLHVQMNGWFLEMPNQHASSMQGEPFAFEDEGNNIAYVVTPYGEEWKSGPLLRLNKSLAFLREPELAPHALIAPVDKVNEDGSIIVKYGWRVEAIDWSLTEFRQAQRNDDGEVEVPRLERSLKDMPGLDEEIAVLEKRIASMNHDLNAARLKWTNISKIYTGKKAGTSTWVIM